MKNFMVVLAIATILNPFAAFAEDCPLCVPAMSGDVAKIKQLISAGSDVNNADHNGSPALISAAGSWRPESVKALLDNGANANAAGEDGITALIATAQIIPGYAKVILDGFAGVNDDNAVSVAKKNSAKITIMLLNAGANVDARDHLGNTALMYAAWSKNIETAKVLLDAGANINATSINGEMVRSYAKPETIRLLKEHQQKKQ